MSANPNDFLRELGSTRDQSASRRDRSRDEERERQRQERDTDPDPQRSRQPDPNIFVDNLAPAPDSSSGGSDRSGEDPSSGSTPTPQPDSSGSSGVRDSASAVNEQREQNQIQDDRVSQAVSDFEQTLGFDVPGEGRAAGPQPSDEQFGDSTGVIKDAEEALEQASRDAFEGASDAFGGALEESGPSAGGIALRAAGRDRFARRYEQGLQTFGESVAGGAASAPAEIGVAAIEAGELVGATIDDPERVAEEAPQAAVNRVVSGAETALTNPARFAGGIVGGSAAGFGAGRALGGTRVGQGTSGRVLRAVDIDPGKSVASGVRRVRDRLRGGDTTLPDGGQLRPDGGLEFDERDTGPTDGPTGETLDDLLDDSLTQAQDQLRSQTGRELEASSRGIDESSFNQPFDEPGGPTFDPEASTEPTVRQQQFNERTQGPSRPGQLIETESDLINIDRPGRRREQAERSSFDVDDSPETGDISRAFDRLGAFGGGAGAGFFSRSETAQADSLADANRPGQRGDRPGLAQDDRGDNQVFAPPDVDPPIVDDPTIQGPGIVGQGDPDPPVTPQPDPDPDPDPTFDPDPDPDPDPEVRFFDLPGEDEDEAFDVDFAGDRAVEARLDRVNVDFEEVGEDVV